MNVRDRVMELRRVRASELRRNPRNWRRHPAAQAAALAGMFQEVGFAGAVLARQCEDGGLELVDGHLRAETMGDEEVPVLVLDLTKEESAAVLATYDPLGAMAETDDAARDALLADVISSSEAVQAMLAETREVVEAPWERADAPFATSYQVAVECQDEADQRKVYEQMREAGYACRVLTL